MDGGLLPSGARFTSRDFRSPPGKVSDADRLAYDKAMVAHLRARGWLERVFVYAPDEPTPEKFAEVKRVASFAHAADPNLRVLLTASEQPALAGVADLWTPNMVCTFARPEGAASGTVNSMVACMPRQLSSVSPAPFLLVADVSRSLTSKPYSGASCSIMRPILP